MNIVFSEPKSVIWVVTNNDLKPETTEADKTILHISKGFFENNFSKLPVALARKIFDSSINKNDLFKYRTYNKQFRQIFNLEYIFKVGLERKSRICLTSGFVLLKQSKMTVQELGVHFAGVKRICFKTSHEACKKDPAQPENDCLFAQVVKTLPKIEAVELTGSWDEACAVFSQLPDLKQFCVTTSNCFPSSWEQILRQFNPRFTGGFVLVQSAPKYPKDPIAIIHYGMID